MSTLQLHCPFSGQLQGHMRWPLGLQLSGGVRGGGQEGTQSKNPAPQHCRVLPRRPTWVSPHRDHWGNLWGLTMETQIDMEKEGQVYSNHHSDFGRTHSSLQLQLIRDCSQRLFASAQLCWQPCLARELGGQWEKKGC